jgi:hypothetical protein
VHVGKRTGDQDIVPPARVARPVRGTEYASRATTFYVSLGSAF